MVDSAIPRSIDTRRDGAALQRDFFRRDPSVVAVELLNKVLVSSTGERARIVEVEAYGGSDDPASHAFRGLTRRNSAMFGPPGHLYVYFTYGMHWCTNAVCMPDGHAGAVLLRAGEPLDGEEAMFGRRARARRSEDLCSGPAKLSQALGLTGAANGVDATLPGSAAWFVDDGRPPPDRPGNGTRVGIRVGTEVKWRWWVTDSRCVSRISRGNAQMREPGKTAASKFDP
jgi:DNA-3-methyladenine glycosylase